MTFLNFNIMIKKFLLPLQNIVRADLFSGSLAVWNVRGEAAHFCPPAQSEPRLARRGNSVRAILRIHRQIAPLIKQKNEANTQTEKLS